MVSAIKCVLLITLMAAVGLAASQPMVCSCIIDPIENVMTVKLGKDPKNGIAWGSWQDNIEKTGYAILDISTNPAFPDKLQMECAGYLEAFWTYERIWEFYQTIMGSKIVFPNTNVMRRTQQFLADNLSWTRSMAQIGTANPQSDDYNYWLQVSLLLSQLDGLVAGYNNIQPPEMNLTADALWMLNSLGDMGDILPAMMRFTKSAADHSKIPPDFDFSEAALAEADLRSHCSAIIKPVLSPSGMISDIFVSHDMWTSYFQMLQIYKHYNFALTTGANKRISMSSYPGLISSEDDFYMLGDSNMAVIETSNSIYNQSLYDSLTPKSLFSWVRAMVAHRLSSNGQEWHKHMSRWNSGTYNNQWMVVDFKLFNPNQQTQLAPGTLWVGEQLPGFYHAEDVTAVLNKQLYWPSYNIPFFEDSYQKAGYAEMRAKLGDVFSYDSCPRASIRPT